MIESFADFHWLRPQLLWALIPLFMLVVLLWRHKNTAIHWRALIDPALLPHLVDTDSLKPAHNLLWGLMLAWLLGTLALAGPVWEQLPTPVHRQANALVLVLDLSPSMVAEDIKPKRIVRARLKIADILKRQIEGETALVVYSGDAHVVTPLTDDTNTISSLLATLSPGIMPLPGSNTEAGIERAINVLHDAGLVQGSILLITDGVARSAAQNIKEQLQNTNFTLSILGVGTDEGAPIPSGKGGFVRNSSNAIIVTKLRSGDLQNLAQSIGGRYITSHFTQQDIDYLLTNNLSFTQELQETDNNIDAWVERGPWLVLFILPLLLYAFRRGVVILVLLVPALSAYTPQAEALEFKDLWQTKNQQANKALQAGDAEAAAEQFTDSAWKASAQYKAGDYENAAEHFSQINTADGHYNRGNALARGGQLDEAIKAYDKALEIDPTLQDATDNKNLVEQVKQQQENKDQQNGDDSEEGDEGEKQENSEQQSDENANSENSSESESESESNQSEQNPSNPDDSQKSGEEDVNNPPEEDADTSEEQEQKAAETEQEGDEPESEEKPGEPGEEQEEEGAEEAAAMADPEMSVEEKQAIEQWLRKIPDDPGGLLRNKFKYQYQKNRQERIRQKVNSRDGQEERW